MEAKLTLKADYRDLADIPSFLGPLLQVTNSREQSQVALAVHELCMNIIQHGFSGESGSITLQAVLSQTRLELNIEDDAPNQYPSTQEIAPPDPGDLPESGWGMYIVYQIMDEVHYQRLTTGNRWHLVKNLETV